jgi:hypothetical protein
MRRKESTPSSASALRNGKARSVFQDQNVDDITEPSDKGREKSYGLIISVNFKLHHGRTCFFGHFLSTSSRIATIVTSLKERGASLNVSSSAHVLKAMIQIRTKNTMRALKYTAGHASWLVCFVAGVKCYMKNM